MMTFIDKESYSLKRLEQQLEAIPGSLITVQRHLPWFLRSNGFAASQIQSMLLALGRHQMAPTADDYCLIGLYKLAQLYLQELESFVRVELVTSFFTPPRSANAQFKYNPLTPQPPLPFDLRGGQRRSNRLPMFETYST